MSDLISRKVLQREIEYLYDLNYGETLIDPREFYDMVDCQPTAYDVDKVVEQLEAKIQPNEDFLTGEPCDNWVVDMQNDLIIECISVVKGAVKDESSNISM